MNICIPMAGRGSRFKKTHDVPKPFIKVDGKMMVINVVENINIPGAKYIFIVQKEHMKIYGAELITQIRNTFVRDFEIVEIDGVTEGAACTLLKAKEFIGTPDELLVVNSDQLLGDGDIERAVKYFEDHDAEGGIICTFNRSQKWSYVKLDDNRDITMVKEKDPISDHATVGVYYWCNGYHFVDAANWMIKSNERYNGEFYLAPTYNYMILDTYKVIPYFVNEFYGLGTPEDLKEYINKGDR